MKAILGWFAWEAVRYGEGPVDGDRGLGFVGSAGWSFNFCLGHPTDGIWF